MRPGCDPAKVATMPKKRTVATGKRKPKPIIITPDPMGPTIRDALAKHAYEKFATADVNDLLRGRGPILTDDRRESRRLAVRDAKAQKCRGEALKRNANEDLKALGAGDDGGLSIDNDKREAFWNGQRLAIGAHADIAVLKTLYSSGLSMIVTYTDLEHATNPRRLVGAGIEVLEAPPAVKDAISHIRKAFNDVGCPWKVVNVRGKGYRLVSDE